MSEEDDRVVTVSILKSELKSALTELENRLEKRFDKHITEEAKTTRRHFDIMVEKVNDSVRLVAEVTAHHSTVLEDHETRLQKIEKQA
jgi:nitrogen fixation/metabolism regulation signal transduction histidine kinase